MKSLDGLIKALEEITSLTEGESESEGYFLAIDSIYYLKEYQEHLKWHAYEEHCLAEEKKVLREKSRYIFGFLSRYYAEHPEWEKIRIS